MNPEQQLAEALGFNVDFERFHACVSPSNKVYEPTVMTFVSLAAERQFALSVVANEDSRIDDVFRHTQEHGLHDDAVRTGEMHTGVAATFQARAAAALDTARGLVPKLTELGVLVAPTAKEIS